MPLCPHSAYLLFPHSRSRYFHFKERVWRRDKGRCRNEQGLLASLDFACLDVGGDQVWHGLVPYIDEWSLRGEIITSKHCWCESEHDITRSDSVAGHKAWYAELEL